MNDNNRLPKADKFLKNRKKLKLWHRLLLMAGSLVVFITTYMLILPAITAEVDTIEIFEESYDSFDDSYEVEYEEAANEIIDDVGENEIIEDTDSDESNEDTDINSETDDTDTDGSTDMDEAAGGGDEADEGSDTDIDASDGEEISEADTDEETTEDVTEETTESTTEEAAEETMEEANSSDDTDEGGGLSSSTTLADGTILTMTAVESEEEKSLFGSIVALADEGTSTSYGVTYGSSTDSSGYVATYDSETGDFTLDLEIDILIAQTSLTEFSGSEYESLVSVSSADVNNTYTYYYAFDLPTGITLTDSLLYDSDGNYLYHEGYIEGSYDIAYLYYFIEHEDEEGNTYYEVLMVFTDAYISSLDGADIKADIEVEITVSSETYTENGTINIENYGITIPAAQIDWTSDDSENITETVNEDLIIYKTVSQNSDGTITYTIRVFTTKGTGDTITITDIITNASSLAGLDEDGLVSITCSEGTVGVYKNNGLNYYGNEQDYITDDVKIMTQEEYEAALAASALTEVCDDDGNVLYYTYADDEGNTFKVGYYYYDESGNMVIVLPGLDSVSSDETYDWSGDDSYTTYNEYYIQYTYEVDPESESSYYVSNTATATTYDKTADTDLTDSSTASTTISGTDIISKSGKYSSGTITWTVTVGDGSTDLTGYVLTDEYLKYMSVNDTITIVNENGDEVDEGEDTYTITYTTDDDGNIVIDYITFNGGTKYVITYTTEVSTSYNTVTYINTAVLTPEDGKTSYSDSYSVTVQGESGGTLSKTLLSAEADEDNSDIYVLNWKTAFEIPETGIPSGTTFVDYINEGYITYAQALEIITALKEAWGEDNITNICFSTYGANMWYTDLTGSDWVSESDLTNDGTVYKAFSFTLTNDAEYDEYTDNTVTIEYSTTADVSSVSVSQTYTNTVFLYGSTSVYAQASYSYTKNVVKYGVNSYGNMTSDDVSLSTSSTETEIIWYVKVILDDVTTYTVTDCLPSGVTLESVSVSNNNYTYTDLTKDDTTSLYSALDFCYTTDETETGTAVILTIEDTSNNADASSSRSTDTVYIKYVCSVNTSESDVEYEFDNSVTVTTTGGSEYGSDEEITTVTYTEETSESNEVTKDDSFNTNGNVLTYTVSLNPDEITYTTGYPDTDDEGNYTGEEYADLTLTDVLTYCSYPDYGIARSVSLRMTSVKLYYAATDSDGSLQYDSDGNLVAGDEVSSSDWSWTYSETSATLWGNNVQYTNTITATVPNGVALVFKYEYIVTIIIDDSATWEDYTASATNYAQLGTEDYTITKTDPLTTTDKVEESSTSGTASGGASYSIYKVDAENFSVTIEDTVFDLYVYDTETSKYVYIDSYTTNSNGFLTVSGVYTNVEEDTVRQYDSTDEDDEYLEAGVYYKITLSGGSVYYVPADTMCYIVESEANTDYKLDTTKYYFYFGSTVATALENVKGYSSSIETVYNVISSHTQYITNTHSGDYYANKTNISVRKTWIDSEGNEYTKTDGSITFNLYRVFTDLEGNQGYSPTDTSSGSSSGSSSEDSSTVTVYLNYTADSSYSSASGAITPVTVDANSTIDVVVSLTFNPQYWAPTIGIMDITSGEILTRSTSASDWVYDSDTGLYNYTYSYDVGTSNVYLYVYAEGYNSYQYSFSVNGTLTEDDTTTTESTTEATTEDSNETTESTTEMTTVVYIHNFSDTSYNTYTEWTETSTYYEVVTEVVTDDEGETVIEVVTTEDGSEVTTECVTTVDKSSSEITDDYFTFTNCNLSDDHGYCVYDLDGDGVVDDDETLTICLKMESKTSISFTNETAGTLKLVFNAAGNGSEKSTIVNSVYIDGVGYTATDNIITAELEAGTHTITKWNTCYLFYMSFTEGLTSSSGDTSGYLHSMQDGTSSTFYSISGSVGIAGTSSAGTYGIVTYNNEAINQFLKLNSKAEITFDAPEDGILYLVMTNALSTYANKNVGVMIDGVTYYASDAGYTDSAGNEIYILTASITAGSHTVTRLSGTEFQLYYIGYVPDDYANAEITDTAASNEYGELVGTYTISYSDAWSWSSANLPAECMDDDGNILGYYTYYIVEVDEEGNYITQYKNVSSDGIAEGTMGIINQIDEDSDSATSVAVQKEWLSSDGTALDDDDENVLDSITVDLYARLNIYSRYADEYDGGTDYSRYFTSASTDRLVADTTNSDGSSGSFFAVTGYTQASGSNLGEVTFKPTTAEDSITTRYYLKFGSDGTAKGNKNEVAEVSFTSPATTGILTLITSNYTSTNLDSGIGFRLTSPSGVVYDFTYSSTNSNGLSGTYPGELSNADETLAESGTGVTVTATSSSSTPQTTGIITFTIFTDEAGEWTIERIPSGSQPYLLYMDFSYQYQYLAEGYGVYVGTYTIDSSTDWYKKITSLPLYIYDDDGTVIGYYSYYIEEVSPSSDDYDVSMEYTLAVDGNIITSMVKDLDNDGYVIVTYLDKETGEVTTFSAAYTSLTYDDDNTTIIAATLATTNLTAMSEGTFKITNKVKETSVVLPESGGEGTTKYMLAGLIMCVGAGLLLYIRSKKLRV